MEEYDGSMMMEENRSLLMEEEDNQAWLSFRHTIEQVRMIILFLKLLQLLRCYSSVSEHYLYIPHQSPSLKLLPTI